MERACWKHILALLVVLVSTHAEGIHIYFCFQQFLLDLVETPSDEDDLQ